MYFTLSFTDLYNVYCIFKMKWLTRSVEQCLLAYLAGFSDNAFENLPYIEAS